MKLKSLALALAAMVIAAATGMAKPKTSGTITLNMAATVAGSQLAAGMYKVEWQTHSPQTTVNFLKDGKVVATAVGMTKDLDKKADNNGVIYDNIDTAPVVKELRFAGSSQAIDFD